jgi:hypothetical protein
VILCNIDWATNCCVLYILELYVFDSFMLQITCVNSVNSFSTCFSLLMIKFSLWEGSKSVRFYINIQDIRRKLRNTNIIYSVCLFSCAWGLIIWSGRFSASGRDMTNVSFGNNYHLSVICFQYFLVSFWKCVFV